MLWVLVMTIYFTPKQTSCRCKQQWLENKRKGKSRTISCEQRKWVCFSRPHAINCCHRKSN